MSNTNNNLEQSEENAALSAKKKEIIFISDPDEEGKDGKAAEETPAEETPTEEAPAEETPVEESASGEIEAEEVSAFDAGNDEEGTSFFRDHKGLMLWGGICFLLLAGIIGFLNAKMSINRDEYDTWLRWRNIQMQTEEPVASENNISRFGAVGDISDTVISAINIPYVDPSKIQRVRVGSHVVMSDIRELDISGTDLTKFNIREALDQLPYLRRLTLIDCNLTNAEYAALQDDYPKIRMIWDIVLSHWTIRTDTVAFSTMKITEDNFNLENDEAYYLKYCTDMVALDIGHNYVSDLSFLEYMPNLKILILVDNFDNTNGTFERISDLSAVSNCKKLRYLEIFSNNVQDLSFLKDLKEIEDLNISYTFSDSIEYLKDFPKLRRLWLEHTNISEEDCLNLIAMYPDAEIVYQGTGSIDQGWRTAPQFFTIRHMFSENCVDPEYE